MTTETLECRLTYWEGKRRWLEARAAVLVRWRGMSEGEAIAKAKDEWQQFRPEPGKDES